MTTHIAGHEGVGKVVDGDPFRSFANIDRRIS